MIRTGYLRWEIEVDDRVHPQDNLAREISFLARPAHRKVIVKGPGMAVHDAAARFVSGTGNYDSVRRELAQEDVETELTIHDIGPHLLRYTQSDRIKTPRFWIEKVRGEARVFAHQVVREASKWPALVATSRLLRLGYARLVEWETLRAIEGRTRPEPTNETEPIRIEIGFETAGIPELVAAELVRDVMRPQEFHEFSTLNHVTLRKGDRIYRISRKSQAMIQVWDATTRTPLGLLCVIFQDPGLPPSDEVVMKYLLVRHEPQMLWDHGNWFANWLQTPFEDDIPEPC